MKHIKQFKQLFENNYLKLLTDNYGDAERAQEELTYYTNVINALNKKGGVVYRIIFAKSIDKINVKKLGLHWTINKNAISRYYANISDHEESKKPFIITGSVIPGSVDLDNSLGSFAQLPDEEEINFTKQPIIKSIKPYKKPY